MNGEIGFSNEAKAGSTFTFTCVFTNGCSDSGEGKNQKMKNRSNFVSTEFHGMRALLIDTRQLRLRVARYHIQRLGISVEVAYDLNHGYVAISSEKPSFNMVLIKQEVWNNDLKAASFLVNRMELVNNGRPPKLFLLANSTSCSGANFTSFGIDTLSIIMKPLKASMLAAWLQRTMGVGKMGNYRNGELRSLPLQHLLRGRKILVVDDNSINLKVATGALKKYGADVECVDSGIKAVEKLTPPHHFDACFIDIQMPEMDGFEATREIRNREQCINDLMQLGEATAEAYGNISNWHVPILAMTADVIKATPEQSLRSGMDGYVSKPFEAEQLYREVSRFFLDNRLPR